MSNRGARDECKFVKIFNINIKTTEVNERCSLKIDFLTKSKFRMHCNVCFKKERQTIETPFRFLNEILI